MKTSVSKLYGIALLAIAFISVVPGFSQTTPGVKNIVIVHGAFADGSGWENVYKILTRRGYNVTLVQNPLSSLEDDVNTTKRILARQKGPVVLVGHSWGGTVITQAGNAENVVRLVYVAAFVPEIGESTLDLAKKVAPAPENGILPPDDQGFIYYDKAKFHSGFAADLDNSKAEFMYASQAPIAAKAFVHYCCRLEIKACLRNSGDGRQKYQPTVGT
jgi:pimeloyl-ACP methyl ester carboxylesterase